jgi:hypothetical protein
MLSTTEIKILEHEMLLATTLICERFLFVIFVLTLYLLGHSIFVIFEQCDNCIAKHSL